MSDSGLGFVPSVADMAAAIEGVKAQIEVDEELRHELTEGHTSGNPMTLGPRLPSPAKWAELQIKGAKDNANKWLENTIHPKRNFREEALKPDSIARFKDSMERAIREGRWEGGMALVDENETIATITKRGASVYANGVEDRAAKILRRVTDLHADRLALCVTVDALPSATEADREAKMIANLRGLKAIGARRRGYGG